MPENCSSHGYILMGRLMYVIILIILAIAFLILLYSPREEPPLFLEVWCHTNGKALEGPPRKLMIDFPTYRFNPDKGELSGLMDFDVNASHILILGMGYSLSGDAGGGVSSELWAIDKLPFDLDNVKILKVEGDSIYLTYEGTNITLEPGDKWEKTREYVKLADGSKIRFTERITIKNYGYVKLRPQP